MKKLFITTSVVVVFFTACSNKQSNEHKHDDGEHLHEDGQLHDDHDTVLINQEEFNIQTDSNTLKESHTHGNEKDHKH